MTSTGWALMAAAGLAALVNWAGVWWADRRLVYVAKPATLAFLIGAALVLVPSDPTVRAWMVVGLVLSLAGDVFLMLPEERTYPFPPFLAGLVSFLLGHIAYIVAMASDHQSWPATALGVAVVAVALAVVAPRVVRGVGEVEPEMKAPVLGYMSVISVMVVAAFGRTVVAGIVGACLFYASDATLAWNRFFGPRRTWALGVIVTYHLGQAGLVLSLLG